MISHKELPAHIHAEYIFRFIDTYREHENILYRECLCTRVRIPYAYADIEGGDLFAGRYRALAVGFSPQENGFGYFLNKEKFREVYIASNNETQEKLNEYLTYWEPKVSERKLRTLFRKMWLRWQAPIASLRNRAWDSICHGSPGRIRITTSLSASE